MPRSWQARTIRTAASPRFAIRTRFSIAAGRGRGRAPLRRGLPPAHACRRRGSHRLELEERLPVLDRLRVLHQDAADDPGVVGLVLVEQLHRLEDAERL